MLLPSTTIAETPFNNIKTDIILQTSDDVQFHVWSIILAEASLVFRDMFTLPQPTISQTAPVIPVSEASQVIDPLLRLCYPVDDPALTDLSLLGRVWEAARKYALDEATKLATTAVHAFISTSPLQVFALACRLEAEEEVKLAAKAWKSSETFRSLISSGNPKVFDYTIAGASYIHEMSGIPSGAYYRLLSFLRADHDPDTPICTTPVIGHPEIETTKHSFSFDIPCSADADVVIQSSDGVDFRVHKLMLRSATAEELLQGEATTQMVVEGLPVVEVAVRGEILAEILKLCYPMYKFLVEDCSIIRQMLQIASLYKMSKVVEVLKKRVMDLLDRYPLSLYFVAVEQSWMDVAEAAARQLAKAPIENLFVEEMEEFPTDAYHRLLKYHHAHTMIVANIAAQYSNGAKRWMKLKLHNHGDDFLTAKAMVPILLPVVEMNLEWKREREGSASRFMGSLTAIMYKSQSMVSDIEEAISNFEL
ncbi:hypothetical protein EW026_g4748 [Hermanssonia centrifuga]|uniref:BTB domain-containing protein n=1 Tax=Hermanssonia centrifuga TaxID=98765 RepID=A0A4S4KG70_9APHY|nr:hypothetical protein EW026_g4748 [Hermanssonia centrifuga]